MSGNGETLVQADPVSTGVLRLRLDGPDRFQALSISTARALEKALDQANSDDMRAVIITGSTNAFCSGADLKSTRGSRKGAGSGTERLEHAHRVITAIRRFRGPVIAAVEGACVGVGWSIALACDLTVASKSAYFLAPFVRRGLIPDSGLIWFLQQSVGPARAAEIVMLAERLTADKAHDLGLVNRVVAPGEAEAFAAEWASQLASDAISGDAIQLSKRLFTAGRTSSVDDFLRIEWSFAALGLQGPDAAEGIASFSERRSPRYTQ